MRTALALALLTLSGAAFADEAKPPTKTSETATCELYANLMKQQRDALEVALANALAELRVLKAEKKESK